MTTKSATLRMPQRRAYSARVRRRRRPMSLVSIPAELSIKAVAAVFVLFMLFLLSFVTSYKIHSVAQDVGMLEQRYSAIQKENMALAAKFASITSQKRLARIGRRLGLHPPAKDQVITLR